MYVSENEKDEFRDVKRLRSWAVVGGFRYALKISLFPIRWSPPYNIKLNYDWRRQKETFLCQKVVKKIGKKLFAGRCCSKNCLQRCIKQQKRLQRKFLHTPPPPCRKIMVLPLIFTIFRCHGNSLRYTQMNEKLILGVLVIFTAHARSLNPKFIN